MAKQIFQILKLLLCCTLLSFCSNTLAMSQQNPEELKEFFHNELQFSDEDFNQLKQGKVVAKLMPPQDKREVAVFGVVPLQTSDKNFLGYFRQSIITPNHDTILSAGMFSNPPALSDLQTLTLERRDIEDIKKCVAGDCNVKLSAEMIERLRREADASPTNFNERADELYRQILFEYVQNYLTQGDSVLIHYHDQSRPIPLAKEFRTLLDSTSYLKQFAPEFAEHLRGNANKDSQIEESFLYWAKVRFGLKPVIIITHVTIYKSHFGDMSRLLIASKQIYANHYFDSSFSLTVFINFAADKTSSYMIYTSRTRADALDNALFGRVMRNTVENQTIDGLKKYLQANKQYFEAKTQNQTETQSGRIKPAFVYVFLFLLFVVGVGVIIIRRILRERRRDFAC